MSTAPNASTDRGMRTFVVVWLGQVVSYVGSAMAAFAIGVKIFQVTGSVSRFALASLAIALPILLVSPLAGRLVDRYDHRKILILSHLGAGGAYLALYLLVSAGRVTSWHVYPLIALGSVFSTFVWPAMSAATTLLVGRAQLGRASGMLQMGLAMAQVAGPLLGGLLLVAMGLPGLIVVNVVSYLLATIALLLVRFPTAPTEASGQTDPPETAGEDSRTATTRTLGDTSGWGFLKARPGLLRLLMLFAVLNFVVGMVQVLITPLVLSFAGPTTLGLVLAIAASGMLVGSTLMAVWGGARRRIPLILITIALQGVILFAASFRPSASLIAIAAFFFLFGVPLVTASSQALWQIKTPVAIQGRVFALRRMIGTAAVPLAQAAAGPLVDYVFEPLAARGAFDQLLGPIVGLGSGADTHAGRGIAVLLVGLGCLLLTAVGLAVASRTLRNAEDEIPDAIAPNEPSVAIDPAARQPAQDAAFNRLRPRHGWLLAGAWTFVAWLALATSQPPEALPADAPDDRFSAHRGLRHIEATSIEPHPIGTAAQARVQAYLVSELSALGLEVEEQSATVSSLVGRTRIVADVVNVLGRQPGHGQRSIGTPRRTVLLVGHYDSVPTSAGAADNGAGVAAILETARALRAGAPLANDVIFLFTDGEELALLGAQAFLQHHTWADDVAVVLNVDARGNSGPSTMFRTGIDNGWWLPHFFTGAPAPRGSSLLASLFALLPNRTDFSLFRARGLPGFDFAFMDGLTHYHTALDQSDAVSLRSVQHQGANLLGITRRLADLDLTSPATDRAQPDRTYFNGLGFLGVHYGALVAWGSVLLAVGLLFAVLWKGRRSLSIGGVALGFLAHLVLLIAIPMLISLLWMGLRDLVDIPVVMGSTTEAHGFMAGFTAIGLAVGMIILRFFRQQVLLMDLAFAGVLWWLLLLVLTSETALPVTTSFIVVWPLNAILLLLFLLFDRSDPMPPLVLCAALFAASLPGLLLLVPLVRDFYVAAQSMAELGGVALLPAAFLLALLVVPIEALSRTLPRAVPLLVAAAGLAWITAAVTSSIQTRPNPELSSVVYTVDTETDRETWFSFDPGPNRWNRQFGFQAGAMESFSHFYPLIGRPLPAAPAARGSAAPREATQDAPRSLTAVTLLAREPSPDGGQSLRLLFEAKEELYGRTLHFTPSEAVRSVTWGEERITWRPPFELLVRVPVPATEMVTLDIDAGTDVTLTLVDQKPSLPAHHSYAARGPADLPRPFLTVLRTDVTLVRSVFELAGLGGEETVPQLLLPTTPSATDDSPTGADGVPANGAPNDQTALSISASTAAAVSSSTSVSN